MPCETVRLEGGGVAIVCHRGQRRRPPRCATCLEVATKQCDAPIASDRTCGAYVCDRCATSAGSELDLCPAHARERSIQGGADWLAVRRRELARQWLEAMKAQDAALEARRSSNGRWDRAVRDARSRARR